jgi:AcrR family transcriptional regulator
MALTRVKILGVASSELSAGTRERILETAWRWVREGGTSAVSVKDIAAAAGVSRQLVYFHYGNRAGLLVAMARHHDEASGFRRRVAEARALAPAEALEALIRAWCAYVPDLLPVARALEAAWIAGDEGGTAWRDRMEDLSEALRRAVERVERDGGLAAGWTVHTAADWLTATLQPATYVELVEARGWTEDDYTERTGTAARGVLLTAC